MKIEKVRADDFKAGLKNGLVLGAKKGGGSFIWMCKIIVPISFLMTLLQWSGWLYQVDFLFSPVMRLINLPSEAALPILAGMLINIYAAIASLTVIPFTIGQMTLIAVFALIAHNLIAEGIIQFKSGINFIKITLVRLVVAILTVLVVSQFFDETTRSVAVLASFAVDTPFFEVLKVWAIDTLLLLIKIFGIIMGIMIVQECLRCLDWVEYLFTLAAPLMRCVPGLSG